MTVKLMVGDCRTVLPTMDAESVDACVTDPPYGLEFMGREWDKLYPDKGKWAGKEHEPTIEHQNDTPHHRSAVRQPAYLKRCQKCGGNSSGAWNRCQCPEPDFRNPPHIAASMQAWHETWAREVYRVLKPGAHLLCFGGTRTHHRLMVALEDAGFEIRDVLMFLYGSGFPKSLDVGKSLDKAAGAKREIVSSRKKLDSFGVANDIYGGGPDHNGIQDITAPATDLARQWDGWGTALKPSYEPIILARKPLRGSVAVNVTAYGTGALNIGATRIGSGGQLKWAEPRDMGYHGGTDNGSVDATTNNLGRWPANVLLSHHPSCVEVGTKRVKSGAAGKRTGRNGYDGGWNAYDEQWGSYADADGMETVAAWQCHPDCPVRILDAQSGERVSGSSMTGNQQSQTGQNGIYGLFQPVATHAYRDTGGASRFFYTAKSSRAERNKGLAGMPERDGGCLEGNADMHNARKIGARPDIPVQTTRNHHPTVKPVDLMQWLVRLVTPKGGTVLDCFAGSGTTGIAADREGMHAILIEQDPEYARIAERRIRGDAPLFAEVEL